VEQEIEAEVESAYRSPNNDAPAGGNVDWGDEEAIMRLSPDIDDVLDDERIGDTL
jgi:hypothetical protein